MKGMNHSIIVPSASITLSAAGVTPAAHKPVQFMTTSGGQEANLVNIYLAPGSVKGQRITFIVATVTHANDDIRIMIDASNYFSNADPVAGHAVEMWWNGSSWITGPANGTWTLTVPG